MSDSYFTIMIVLSSCNHSPAKCPPWSLHGLSSLNDVNQYHHDRDDQENVKESSHRVRGDQTQSPEEKQNNGEGLEHFHPLLPGFSANGIFGLPVVTHAMDRYRSHRCLPVSSSYYRRCRHSRVSNTIIPPTRLGYRLLSVIRDVVCLKSGSVFVLWFEGIDGAIFERRRMVPGGGIEPPRPRGLGILRRAK